MDWATKDPAAGAAWIATLPEDSARTDAIRNFANRWFQTSPTAAAEWAENLPPAQHDAALQSYVEILNNTHQPTAAWDQAFKLTDPEQRYGLLNDTLRNWDDAQAAQAALAKAPLDGETKQALKENCHNNGVSGW